MFRSTALLLAGLFLFSPLPAAAQTAPVETLHVGVIPAEISGCLFYGIDKGYFKAQGLNIDVQLFTNGGAIAAGIASGALDVGITDLVSIASAHARGLPLVYIAPGLLHGEKAPTYGIIVAKDSPVKTAADFNGKTMAVNGLKNISQLGLMTWVDNNGGDSKSIKFTEMPFSAMPPAIAAGTVTGGLPNEPALSAAENAGDRVIVMDRKAVAPIYMLSGFVTSRTWAEAHKDAAKRFAAAIHEAAVWANKNHDESAPILASYTKIPLPVVRGMRRGNYATEFNPGQIQPMIDAAAKYGFIDKTFPMSDILYTAR
jgi:NitT/TauT family transport system substrate-binding protein